MVFLPSNDPRAGRPLPAEVFPTLLPPEGLGRSYPQMPSGLRSSLLQRVLSILGIGRETKADFAHKSPKFTSADREEGS